MARQQLGERLNARIGTAGSVFVEHPSERRLLACLDRTDLEAFAQAHQLNVVRRVGGRVFEFTRRRPGPNA